MRTLADDLLVLAIGGNGRLRQAALLPYGLRGAELADLVTAGRVTIETRGGPIRLTVPDPSPVGDELLDRALQWVLREPPPVHPAAFIRRPAGTTPLAHLRHLAALGTVRLDTPHAARQAPPIVRLVLPADRDAARARVDRAVDPGRPAAARDEALAALVQSIGLGDRLYAGPLRRRRRGRLNELAQRHWAALVVRRSVPGARSEVSLPWTGTQFGGLPPGAAGPNGFA